MARTVESGPEGPDEVADIGARHRMGALLLAVALTLAVLALTPVIPLNGGWDSDGRFYGLLLLVFEGVAEVGEVPPPWRWRLLAPGVASLLPFEPLTSFRVLGMLSAGAGLLVVYQLARRSRLEHAWALVAMLLYGGIFWTVKFPAWSPAYVDAETQLLWLGGLLLARQRRMTALMVLMALGGLQKMSLAALAVPAAVAWAGLQGGDDEPADPPRHGEDRPADLPRHGDPRPAHQPRHGGGGVFGASPVRPRIVRGLAVAVVLAGITLAVAFALRLSFPATGGMPRPAGPLRSTVFVLTQDGAAVRLALAVVSGIGLLWVLPLAAPRAAWAFLRREPFWAIQIPLGLLLLGGGVDKARLFLYMAPALAILGAVAVRAFHRRAGRAAPVWVAATLLAQAALGHHLRPLTTTAEYLGWLVPVHAPEPPVRALLTGLAVVSVWAVFTALLGFQARRARSR